MLLLRARTTNPKTLEILLQRDQRAQAAAAAQVQVLLLRARTLNPENPRNSAPA